MKDNLEIDSDRYYWYTLRVFRNEEKCIATINEHIAHRNLQDRIAEVKLLKEYHVIESDEYSPSSDDLPKRGFKSTETSAWVRISNGNYKRIRIVERKPFSGMIFIRMDHDPELFKMIRSWDAGFSFLGGNLQPQVMSDADFRKTEEALSKEVPDLRKYIEDKNYLLLEGSLNIYRQAQQLNTENTEEEKETSPEVIEEKNPEIPEDSVVSRKAQIYSDLQIKEYEGDFSSSKVSLKSKGRKHGQKFLVNDFVFVAHLGFKGVIQEIDYSKDYVVVGVQMFGRRQPVECKISEISSI